MKTLIRNWLLGEDYERNIVIKFIESKGMRKMVEDVCDHIISNASMYPTRGYDRLSTVLKTFVDVKLSNTTDEIYTDGMDRIKSIVGSEEFLDDIIKRIKRKQL